MHTKRFSLLLGALLVVILTATALPATPALAEAEGRFEVKFSGVIGEVPTTAGQPWIIAGQPVTVNSATRIVLVKGPAAPGQWADVVARRQTDGTLLATRITVMPPEVRLRGPISAKPADPQGLGAWTIAGQTVWVTADTRIDLRRGALAVGGWVEVVAAEQAISTAADAATGLVALRLGASPAMTAVEVTGAIQVFSDTAWILSSIPVSLTAETLVTGVPQVGLIAHAAALLADDGTLTARRLRVEWLEPGGQRQMVEISGTIESLPPRGLEGLWTVAGKTVLVLPNTAIRQEKGLAVVGATVQVRGWQLGNALTAAEITVLTSPAEGGQFVRFGGEIEALPTGGLIGAWTVSGQAVQVNDKTRIEGAQFAAVGARVQGEGYRLVGGAVVATWLRVMPTPAPRPTHTPMPTMTPRPTRTPRP